MTGYKTDVAGELGLQAFYAAQAPGGLPWMLLAMGFLNTALYAMNEREARFEAIARGWEMGGAPSALRHALGRAVGDADRRGAANARSRAVCGDCSACRLRRSPRYGARMNRFAWTCAGLAAVAGVVCAAACNQSGTAVTAPPSPGPFGDTPPIASTTQLANLSGPVDVVRDHNGLVHIWATSAADALRVEGYQIAKDRTAQLELVRRVGRGRTAELLGDADPSLIDQDIAMRMVGLLRVAQQMYDALPPDSQSKA